MAHLRSLAAVGCLTLGVGDVALLDLVVLPDLLVERTASAGAIAAAGSPSAVAPVAAPVVAGPAVAALPGEPVATAVVAPPAGEGEAIGGAEAPPLDDGARGEGVAAPTSSRFVFFALDRATLGSSGRDEVERIAAALRDDPALGAVIEGHADALGSEGHNEQLSQERADAVAAALVDLGIEPDRVETQAFGERKPLVTGRAARTGKNRRVEIHLARLDEPRSRP
jgi:outer membrane protein OmpA-like peptidoglycan-associated protein